MTAMISKDEVAAELREAFVGLFMDGRNEHGTHIIVCPQSSIHDEEFASLDPGDSYTDGIFCIAEEAGHRERHSFISIWRYVRDTEHANNGYWEFQRISPLLTELFYGTPEQQDKEFADAEAAA